MPVGRAYVKGTQISIKHFSVQTAARKGYPSPFVLLYLAWGTHSAAGLSSSISIPDLPSGIDMVSSSYSISCAWNRSTKRSTWCSSEPGCVRTRRPIGSAVVEAVSAP